MNNGVTNFHYTAGEFITHAGYIFSFVKFNLQYTKTSKIKIKTKNVTRKSSNPEIVQFHQQSSIITLTCIINSILSKAFLHIRAIIECRLSLYSLIESNAPYRQVLTTQLNHLALWLNGLVIL